ncbi:hypothetical protein [Phocoenobacter skyensis]|uniref:Uncharacterized protein n=1 Tax=Phocoenobacter skyensis TaxID=97481 RepID=A0A1H7XJN6_9PAST|nr:hypothetical protein [Pasteurella skyensis]MDP8184390.1 hypothetical protein [Pasteurella skyensis]QLB22607.1 hypothetical protein A6B44_05060 [Pasteurella skyensis]SEM33873.1 hypothetical protein SAMN05444853_1134 [Pasteurella skyensis]
MRTLTKTIRNKIRSTESATDLAVFKSVVNYTEKMNGKGWYLDQEFCGDAGLYRETILEMFKLSRKETEAKIAEAKKDRDIYNDFIKSICEKYGFKSDLHIEMSMLSNKEQFDYRRLYEIYQDSYKEAVFFKRFYNL